MTKINTREIVLDILIEVLEHGQYSHLVTSQALSKYQFLEKPDRGMISRIVSGTIEYLIQIDYTINLFSKTKVNKMKPLIRTLLRMSVYQILYMDRIPDSAVCNEAVKLAQQRKFHGLKGFVNGVLRTVSREKVTLVWPDLAIKYAMPDWIINMWHESYNSDVIETMLKSFLTKKRITVRCNQGKADLDKVVQSLTSRGVNVERSEFLSSVLYLEKVDYLDGLEAFSKGWIQVQDMSSVFVGLLADPKAGDYVMDVCSAPGGKSIHLADLLNGTGHVDARDLSDYKVQLIEENIIRSGYRNISAQVWDALVLDQNSIGKADIVLADLPCSGLGIIGKKPDIKLNVTPEKLEQLMVLQREMLAVVQHYVKPGGILVYSTCTINRMENQENAAWFLDNFPFEPVNIKGRLGTEITEPSLESGWIQLIPGIHPCDGFFIAVFRKRL